MFYLNLSKLIQCWYIKRFSIFMLQTVSAENLKNEVRRVRHIRSFETQIGEMVGHWNSLDLLQWLMKWNHQISFPNLLIMLRTFLTMCVSVASCERSFSKLKLIKTYLRSTMGQERLSSLCRSKEVLLRQLTSPM